MRKKASVGFNSPLIFRFKELKSLLAACKRLFHQYSHLIRKSSLYLLDEEYFLILYSYLRTDEKLIKLLSEYGKYFGKGEIKLSFMNEHARCIVEDAAVETRGLCLLTTNHAEMQLLPLHHRFGKDRNRQPEHSPRPLLPNELFLR